jgi:hypothetical protein
LLFATAGLRARNQFRQQYEILMGAQMRCEARFAQNEERFAKLMESQARTDRSLNSLIEIIKKGSNGSESRDREAKWFIILSIQVWRLACAGYCFAVGKRVAG